MGRSGTLRAVIIDHYDSYTNNLLQLLQNTSRGAGDVPYPEWSVAVVRFDQFSWDTFKDTILPSLDAIILSPGPGTPTKESDFGFNSKLIKESNIPILGICLGHQGIGTTFGAKIIHTPNIKHGQVCRIGHTDVGIFKNLPQEFKGVRYNSLVLDSKDLPDELELTAWTFDPEDPSTRVVMGVQHRNRPIFGSQWHPESVCSTHGQQIINNFRNIVLQFWTGSGWAQRCIAENASLPDSILNKGAIVREAREIILGEIPPARRDHRADSRHYYIKSVALGRGPAAQVVFDAAIRNTSADGEAWLDSARVRDVHSRNSYLAAASLNLSYSSRSKILSIYQRGKRLKSEQLQTSYWAWLDHFHSTIIQRNVDVLDPKLLDQEAEVGQPLFQVGLIGYFGYELKREALSGYTYSPDKPGQEMDTLPDSQHMLATNVLRLDNYTGEWKLFSLIRRGHEDPIGDFINASSPVGQTEAEFDSLLTRIKRVFGPDDSHRLSTPSPLPRFTALDDEASYSQKIRAAQNAIKEGEAYEVTITTKFKASCPDVDPYALYLSLRERNPAPYSAYIDFRVNETTILSSSPERFISIDADGVAEMKPIKGTLAVSPDKEEDERRKSQLATDVKELAENLMIVDLIRADLHNISPSKSIKVPKLLHVESYETVHQLVTTIQSHIAPNVGGVQVLERCFPPGSMTGAPKLRAVQILDGLEEHRERGIYSGSLGYVCASGTVDQSVVIRTIVKYGKQLELGAGGAITWLSEAEKEWDEVMVKANAVATALPRESAPDAGSACAC
ncbi:Protein phosphatase PP2A regulatory subunit B [Coccidioides posadasii str. Silveira]|uniref:aminodeoxychorismate synthase n=1 Tax=Coccidioides posadasii (strain RMSCC 757 / Silveira) TaxID=443226 RepID=E9CY87_COCPS|nr:anthranilate synthase component II [Coccidioides posadasii str. Silveira]QVM08101.1 Protein phosphatase PP2A regulatory subunit B [Coccidioides posadasii str. Silveira]